MKRMASQADEISPDTQVFEAALEIGVVTRNLHQSKEYAGRSTQAALARPLIVCILQACFRRDPNLDTYRRGF
jgi:hypothetical protein